MIINSRVFGKSDNKLIILHGFLGSLDNWITIAKKISDLDFEVHIVDQRNHGKSFHSENHSYELMTIDLRNYIEHFHLDKASIIGHSMGGKTACYFALNHSNMVDKLIIVDILPIKYKKDYNLIFRALNTIDLNSISNRFDIDNHLKKFFKDKLFISFLSKNLVRSKDGSFRFKCNLSSLINNIDNILDQINSNIFYEGKTFFIKGLNSDYITDEGLKRTKMLFPNYNLIPVEEGGHWLHHEKQKDFFNICKELLTT